MKNGTAVAASNSRLSLAHDLPSPVGDEAFLETFVRRDENAILFSLFGIVERAGPNGRLYTEMNREAKHVSAKLTPLQVAHYSKKLEKLGFFRSTTLKRTSERKVYTSAALFSRHISSRFDSSKTEQKHV